jgi:pimeloyl-ACP methyl ester carboxylesterase
MNKFNWCNVTIDGLRIRYLKSENININKNINPLLMLPGFPLSVYSFGPLIENLNDMECYAVNLPGYGGSLTNNYNYHSFKYYCSFLTKFHNKILQNKKVNLFGYSTGGVVGLVYTHQHSKKIDKLIIFSAPYNGIKHFKEMINKRPKLYKLQKIVSEYPIALKFFDISIVKKTFTRLMYKYYYKNKYPSIKNMNEDFMKTLYSESCKFSSKALLDLGVDISKNDFSNTAKEITNPTLILSASLDEAVSTEESKKLAGLFKGKSIFRIILNEGHDVVIINPFKVANEINKFISN